MNTDELAKLLATGAEPVDPRVPLRRFALAVGAGIVVAAIVMAEWLGVRSTLADDVAAPMLWIKFAFVAWLAVGGWMATLRLARPGASLARVPGALAGPVLAMWLLAAVALAGADAPRRAELVFGQTWGECLVNIAVLSLPVFAAALWGMKGFAPTRPRRGATSRSCSRRCPSANACRLLT